MPRSDSFKPMFAFAGLAGAIGIGAATGGFLSGIGGNVFAGFLYDGCKAVADEYARWREPPDAPARNYDLSFLAGRSIASVVAATKKNCPPQKPGFRFLDAVSKIEPRVFADLIDSPAFSEISSDKLVEFLGAPHGGLHERAGRGSIWYKLLVAALQASNQMGDLSALNERTDVALVEAAKRLWERFPAQFNGELRNEPRNGERAWIAFQSQMHRRTLELARFHFESHQQLRSDYHALVNRIDRILATLAQSTAPNGSAPDLSLHNSILQTRNLAGSIYAVVTEIDQRTQMTHQDVQAIRTTVEKLAVGPNAPSPLPPKHESEPDQPTALTDSSEEAPPTDWSRPKARGLFQRVRSWLEDGEL